MKKFLASLLVGITISFPVLAEEIDLSSLTLSELESLDQSVHAEMSKRGASDGEMFPAGQYVVGKSIRAGNYLLTVKSVDRYTTTDQESKCYLEIYNSDGSPVVFNICIEPDTSFFLGLEDGMTLGFYYGMGVISTATQSWVAD